MFIINLIYSNIHFGTNLTLIKKNKATLRTMTPFAIVSMGLCGCNQSRPAPESEADTNRLDRTVLPVKEPVNPAIT